MLGAVVVAVASLASAAETEVSIPFANRGGINDWQADRDVGLWVQDVHRHWYYAKLMAPCIGLPFATALKFDTRPNGTLDRFSAIIVPHEGPSGRCALVSLTASAGPPTRKKPSAPPLATPPATQG
jgi:hypothetical protein